MKFEWCRYNFLDGDCEGEKLESRKYFKDGSSVYACAKHAKILNIHNPFQAMKWSKTKKEIKP